MTYIPTIKKYNSDKLQSLVNNASDKGLDSIDINEMRRLYDSVNYNDTIIGSGEFEPIKRSKVNGNNKESKTNKPVNRNERRLKIRMKRS